MNGRTTRDVAAAVAAGAGVLLLADLSLGWYAVRVTAAGTVDIRATSSGWSGVGIVAGLLTIAMLVSMSRTVRRARSIDVARAGFTAVLGFAVFGFAAAAALSGSASISAPAAAVEFGSRLWPAYAGIGLGAILAAGTLVALAEVLHGVTEPVRAVDPAR